MSDAPALTACLLPSRGLIRIGGNDARSFLQGLITNNVDRVDAGEAIYAALLTPQGKLLHDFFLWADGPDLLLDCAASGLKDLGKRLAFYRLRADVTLADASADYEVAALWGDGAEAAVLACEGCLTFTDPRVPALGKRIVAPAGGARAALAGAGAEIVDVAEYDRHRLELGIPDAGRDMPPGETFPLEHNLAELNAVDFQKGCFVGQEVTSRTHRRGSVRKRLLPVVAEGALPAPGTPVSDGRRTVGELRSGAGTGALALLRLDSLDDAELTAGDARLHVHIPDWLSGSLEQEETVE